MSESAATVFVINSVLIEREPDCFSEVCSELSRLFSHAASMDSSPPPDNTHENRKNPHPQTGKIILILATKQDLQVSMSIAALKAALNLPMISHNLGVTWRIQGVSGITGEGLDEAFDWLCVQLNAQEPFVRRGYRTAAEDLRIQCSCMRE
ncbi:hypothetical protein BGZ97_012980 [Linnemannia gamsii]|uniref:Uncharacterized protein n=1 Tax=Linnemannia gamsii TaxID=64522 RepID=A0A9P6UKX1_9FUNG|nr:hypothetical protein BGZ97_012980 [Linnemannia gamsii]